MSVITSTPGQLQVINALVMLRLSMLKKLQLQLAKRFWL